MKLGKKLLIMGLTTFWLNQLELKNSYLQCENG